jgi:hypothetical protein
VWISRSAFSLCVAHNFAAPQKQVQLGHQKIAAAQLIGQDYCMARQ